MVASKTRSQMVSQRVAGKQKDPMAAVHSASVQSKHKRRKKRKITWISKASQAAHARNRFNAFEVKQEIEVEGKKVLVKSIVSPETGIHSRDWALSIKQQASPFLTLPIEIRNRIYELALTYPDSGISPHKVLTKFRAAYWGGVAVRMYTSLSQVCRQLHVDVVGGALLYKHVKFDFASSGLMISYLSRINPAHVASIRSVDLHISIWPKMKIFPAAVIRTLNSLRGLRYLYLEIRLAWSDFLTPFDSKCRVRGRVCKEVANPKNWAGLRGLKGFNLSFLSQIGPVHDVTLAEEIRKMVMQEK